MKSWFDQFVHFAVAYLHLKPMCFALTWSEIAYCLSSSAGCIRCVQQMDSQFFFDLSNNRVINTFPIYISPSKLLNITESNPFFQSKTYAEQQNKTHENGGDLWRIPVPKKPYVLWRQIQVGWCGISAGNQQWPLELEMMNNRNSFCLRRAAVKKRTGLCM